jgi:Cu/Ag efflux pump CusA
MAVTVLGGLLSSTLLNLIVLPALAQRYIIQHEPPMAGARVTATNTR